MAGPGPQSIDRRQAWFGPQYVGQVVSQAGYPWKAEPDGNDVYSFDGSVGIHPGTSLHVQVKCYRGTFKQSKSYPIKDAWRENWEDLTQPAYFVVVELPGDVGGWLDHDPVNRSTLARASAYWARIDPLDPDQKSIQVRTADRFTAATVDLWRTQFLGYAAAHGLLRAKAAS